MPHFIKTGFWEKKYQGLKEWLNLDDLIDNRSHAGFPLIKEETMSFNNTTISIIDNNSNNYLIGVKVLRFPHLKTITNYISMSIPISMTIVDFPELETSLGPYNDGTMGIDLGIQISVNLTALNFPKLKYANYISIYGDYVIPLQTIEFPSLISVISTIYTSININSVNGITNVSFPKLTTISATGYQLRINQNQILTNIDLPVLTNFNGNVRFDNNALSVTCINRLLAKFVEIGLHDVTVELSGETNATPTGQGLIDVATLVSNGCTVNYN